MKAAENIERLLSPLVREVVRRKWQKRINPFWGKLAGGCNINRNIPSLIQNAGFEIVELEEMYLPKTPKIAGYNYWGYAVEK